MFRKILISNSLRFQMHNIIYYVLHLCCLQVDMKYVAFTMFGFSYILNKSEEASSQNKTGTFKRAAWTWLP